jgi:hypothetical protein
VLDLLVWTAWLSEHCAGDRGEVGAALAALIADAARN